MADEIEKKLAGELLALLSHDLRNPLAALYSNIGFVLSSNEPMSADHREALDDGVLSCDGITHVIENIELIGRALRGRRGDIASVGLEEIALATVDATRRVATGRGVTIVFTVDETARDVEVHTNGDDFGRALANLVHNAVQFSRSRGEVRVSVRAESDRGVVRIEDDGVAFSEPARARVFTPEGQIASKLAPDGRYSRGLGLLCARLSADTAKATIDAKPLASGVGNAFELSAPRI